jgi:acetoin utilization protein AcuB
MSAKLAARRHPGRSASATTTSGARRAPAPAIKTPTAARTRSASTRRRRAEPGPGELTVASFMTPAPHLIGRQQTLAVAHLLMRTHGIRHLPVLDGGRLVGVVSERDLHLVETLTDTEPMTTLIEEAMTQDPLTVSPDARLADVAKLMHTHRRGSVIVVDRGHVVGIFTAVDALRVLADLASGKDAAGNDRPAGASTAATL